MTEQNRYTILRNTLSSNDTDLTASQKTWAYFETNFKPSVTVIKKSSQLPRGAKIAEIIFDHKNADSDTATFIIYAYREGGPAEFVCTGVLTAGAQETDDSTARYYADTIATFSERWPKAVEPADASANNGVAKVAFDPLERKFILCLFTVISSSDDVRAKIAAYE